MNTNVEICNIVGIMHATKYFPNTFTVKRKSPVLQVHRQPHMAHVGTWANYVSRLTNKTPYIDMSKINAQKPTKNTAIHNK